jgi:hypothetical protein
MADVEEERLVRVAQGVVSKLLRDMEWNSALEWAAKWIEGSVESDASDRLTEFARNMAMSIRASKRQISTVEDVAQSCGGYYCSEEHGHIDCAQAESRD